MVQNLLLRSKYAMFCCMLPTLLFISPTFSQSQIFANQVIMESHVDNAVNATMNNNDFATLNSFGGIAIGVGSYTGELELQFPDMVPANTTTYIRFDFDTDYLNALLGGSLGGLLADVIGGVIFGNHYFNVEARNNTTTVLSSSSQFPPSDGSFRIVRDAEGNFYIAITPSQDYNRIYIEDNTDTLLLGISNSMEVYYAFYFDENQCALSPLFTDYDGSGITLDLININGAGVTNPEFAIDADTTNFSEISLGILDVVASMEQNIYFPATYSPQQEFGITFKTDPILINLGLLNNIETEAYEGTNMVFTETISSLITPEQITLLQNGEEVTVVFDPNLSFDRVTLRVTSLLSVNIQQSIDFYGVQVFLPGPPTTNNVSQTFCAIDAPTISNLQVNESNVIWYDVPMGGNPYNPTDPLVDGGIYYGAQVVDNCESPDRLEVDVTINDTPTPTTSNPQQEFCVVDNPAVADLQATGPSIVWYDAPAGGNPYSPTDPLVDGITYYASATDATGCESSIRLAVTVALNDTPTPTTSNPQQEFCVVDSPTVANLQATGPNIVWYDAPVGGNPYDLADPLVDGVTYHATATDATGCESSTRLAVTVTLNDTATPTGNAQQNFCAIDEPTVTDLQATGPNIIWYDAAVGGNPFDPADPLIDGNTYYATATDATGCESSVRLAVTVTIDDTAAPTGDGQQNFCVIDGPTVADLQATGPNIVWYDAPVGGNPYNPTDPLVDGTTYYASATDTTGCESTVRLDVTANINDTVAPTGNGQQNFCVIDNPTVGDLQATGPNIIWYNAPVGGTPYNPSDPLIDGNTYYASATDTSGCESSVRFQVTVNIDDTATPTGDGQQTFCAVDSPTVADLQASGPNVIWYDAPVGGNPYSPVDPLVDGTIYYASATDASGCESSIRLQVVAVIENGTTPSGSGQQHFCAIHDPIVADLQATGSSIVWYDAPEGGNAYNATDSLIDGNTYYAAGTDATGCESLIRLEVTVTIENQAQPGITSDTGDVSCLQTVITYTTESDQANYFWDMEGGIVVEGGGQNDNYIAIEWMELENTWVSVWYEDASSCGASLVSTLVEDIQVCSDIHIQKTVDNAEPVIGEEITFQVTISNDGPNDFFGLVVYEAIQSGFEYVSHSTTLGTYSPSIGQWDIEVLPTMETAELFLTVKVLNTGDHINIASVSLSDPEDSNPDNNTVQVVVNPLCLVVYNEFSPNSDGINDVFTISCIEEYPDNQIKIFNRYGSLVYQKNGYRNEWNGSANVGNVQNEDETLPSGTYFYVLEINELQRQKSGWLYLIK